jgi:molybdopterin/thiamine biosynthesis adenylyltransferase
MKRRADGRVLIVGVGGLGSPAAIALAVAGVGTIGIADDDVVERSNLHRQILFDDVDVGRSKVEVAADSIRRWVGTIPAHADSIRAASPPDVRVHATRLLPGNAVDLVREYDVVVEGSDNFATKFLASDACALARVPVVHAAAVRWHGTVLAVGTGGRPCYRCLFEDLPTDHAPNCAEAGVMGPAVGIVGAIQADLTLALLDGADVVGTLVTFDGKTDELRRRRIPARPSCALCGKTPNIASVDASRYTNQECS